MIQESDIVEDEWWSRDEICFRNSFEIDSGFEISGNWSGVIVLELEEIVNVMEFLRLWGKNEKKFGANSIEIVSESEQFMIKLNNNAGIYEGSFFNLKSDEAKSWG